LRALLSFPEGREMGRETPQAKKGKQAKQA